MYPVPLRHALAFAGEPSARHSRCYPMSGLTDSPLLRPTELLASLSGDFYFRAFNGLVTLPIVGYNYGGNWTIPPVGLAPTRSAACVAALFLSTFLEGDLPVPSELAEGAKGVSLGNLAIPEGRLASLVFLGRERPLECATRPCWTPSSLNSWYVLTRRWRRRCAPLVARGAVARCT